MNSDTGEQTFVFEITEHLTRIITITAETKEKAYRKVLEQYRNEKIILDASDYIQTDILDLSGHESKTVR